MYLPGWFKAICGHSRNNRLHFFFPSKILGCYGDGGAVFTDSRELAEKIKALASHGQSIKYRHEYIGLNSRLDTVQAAVLRVKLPHVDKWISHRRRAAANYNDMLSDLEMIVCRMKTAWEYTYITNIR